MKKLLLVSLGLCLASIVPAQGPADNPPATKRTASELNELLGPIALYPDALIALILPASTVPSDVVLGARFVAANGNPANVEDKGWDSSVKALTRYPDTLKWLDENLEWTAQVGDAFIEQPVEVMESIQQLRAKARALGNLVDTPEQRIITDENYIRIIPAQQNFIYEPRYDPDVVYIDRPVSRPFLTFSSGYGIGSWLNYDWDWRRHRLYRGEWHEGWDYDHERNRRGREDYSYINNSLTNAREWHPDAARYRAQSRSVVERNSNDRNLSDRTQRIPPAVNQSRDHHSGIVHPKAITGAPHHREDIQRNEPSDGGKRIKDPSDRAGNDNKSGDSSRGHTPTPKTEAPSIKGDGKNRIDGRNHADHKKPENELPPATRHTETPSKKEVETRPHVAAPKHEEPKHPDTPKKIEEPKHEESKHKDIPKKIEEPKPVESKHRDAPKHEEPQKHQELKKPDVPKHAAENPGPDTDKSKSKGHDKKKDEDRKKDEDKKNN